MTFPHSATIQRMTKVGMKYTYGDRATTKCFLQPLDSISAQAFGITFTKAFSCYVPLEADVTEKDQLVIDGRTYGVKGFRLHNYGSLAHKRLFLEVV